MDDGEWRAVPGLTPSSDVGTDEPVPPARAVRDGRAWRLGSEADVAWIRGATPPGLEITSAVPAVFPAYATVVVAYEEREENLQVVLRLLREWSGSESWWLGYLDTGVDDVVFPDAHRVRLYADWPYVLVQAGPDEAWRWRDRSSWRPGPDLIFPADRSWLLSWLWDDDWRCLGGPDALVDRFLDEPGLQARRVGLDEDATPPGHAAF